MGEREPASANWIIFVSLAFDAARSERDSSGLYLHALMKSPADR